MLFPLLCLAVVLPLSLIAGISDLRTMKIPNWISIAIFVGFVVIAVFFLPFDTYLWRIGAGLTVLVVGFFLNSLGVIGGGDVKFLSAITPYVAFQDVAAFLFIFSISLLATLALHRIAMRIGPIRRATDGWASWEAGRNFPMGTSIATAIIVYLSLKVING